MPRPPADRFLGKRNLFLIPNFIVTGGPPEHDPVEHSVELIDRYWSEVRDAISNLERSLGPVSKIYHEMICADDDEGLMQIEMLNPNGYALIRTMCQSTGTVRWLEDVRLIAEHTDWQRVLEIRPISDEVANLAVDRYEDTLDTRYEKIGERIAGDLEDGETGALFIRGDHRVQFPPDIQVFYVAPPALDPLMRWLTELSRKQAAAGRADEWG